MNAIVNVDAEWGIGKDGDLLFPISEDLQFFKRMTLGKIVVMGRQTLASFPGGKPLPKRTNIVLTHNKTLVLPDVTVCYDLEQLKALLANYPPDDVFLIGGSSIYSQLIDSCSFAYVTKVKATGSATHYFPNLDTKENWVLQEESETHFQGELPFWYCTYQNKTIKPILEI